MTFGAIKTFDNKFIRNNVVLGIYVGVFEVAAKYGLPGELNEPLGVAVTESLEKFIRSTVALILTLNPPPNQP
ncbi:MAG: hypothetical protein EB127_21465, partial [Alphaproteobacteria bacterium]|nr:hypothetical protein [Alphaproteobacteria bacterium]